MIEFIETVMQELRTYMISGSDDDGIIGLGTDPVFVIRQGSGIVGDEDISGTITHNDSPGIVFVDDQENKSGIPFVVMNMRGISESERYCLDRELFMLKVTFDCIADESNGALTRGNSLAMADQLLASAVYDMIRPEKARVAMRRRGWRRSEEVIMDAPDDDGYEYKNPVSVDIEVYKYA